LTQSKTYRAINTIQNTISNPRFDSIAQKDFIVNRNEKFSNNHFYFMPKDSNNYSTSNIIKKPITSINNNVNNLNYNSYINNVVIPNNLGTKNSTYTNGKSKEFKRGIFDNGNKFNNVQTTYVVYSKNSNSRVKIIPKPNKTIDFEKNKSLPRTKVINTNNVEYSPTIQQNNNTYIISDRNTNYNQNCIYQLNSPVVPSSEGIKKYKSQNNMVIKKEDNRDNLENININNYQINLRDYMGSAFHGNNSYYIDGSNNKNSYTKQKMSSIYSNNDIYNNIGYKKISYFNYNQNYAHNNNNL